MDTKIFDFEVKPFTVEEILSKLTEGTIEIPKFQRNFVWESKKSKTIHHIVDFGLSYTTYNFVEGYIG